MDELMATGRISDELKKTNSQKTDLLQSLINFKEIQICLELLTNDNNEKHFELIKYTRTHFGRKEKTVAALNTHIAHTHRNQHRDIIDMKFVQELSGASGREIKKSSPIVCHHHFVWCYWRWCSHTNIKLNA